MLEEHSGGSVNRSVACAVLALVVAATAAAQEPDDWEEQDRKYQERLQRRTEAPPAPADPEAAARELRKRYIDEADRLIRDRNFAFAQIDGIEVRTDDPRLDVRAAAGLLASFRKYFDATLEGRVRLAPYDGPAKSYLFWSYAKFNELTTGKARFDDSRPTGHYRPALDVCTVHTDGVPPGDLPDVLVHEFAHQLLENRVLPGAPRPPWLDEGLAEYFGFTARDADGTFRAGKIGGKSAALFREGEATKAAGADRRLKELTRGMRESPSWTVDELLRLDDDAAFYGTGLEMRYGAAFAVVHFLLHGDGGKYAGGFWAWVAELPNAPADVDALYRAVGLSKEDFQERFAKYAKSIS